MPKQETTENILSCGCVGGCLILILAAVGAVVAPFLIVAWKIALYGS